VTSPAEHLALRLPSPDQPTLVDPPIEDLLARVGGSKFTLVVAGALRARDITEYYNGLGQGHGKIVPPQVRSLSNKSLSIAYEELYQDRLTVRRPSPEEVEAERLAKEIEDAKPADTDLDAFDIALREA
jgi:DNA-directed RNA polymerase omega subunit